MKKIMKKLACAALTAALVITSLAVAPDTQAAPKTKKIVMNKKSVKLAVGEKYKLKVKKVKPAKASKKVTYKTTKKSVATVTKKGVIKAKAVGTAKIKVTSKVNKKAKATVKVTVTTPSVVSPSAQPTTPVQNITPNPTATAPVDTATDVPAATDTPKPTRTPRPTAVPTTPTPEPTPPTLKDPGAPYELPFVLDGDTPNIVPQGDATVEANGDGSVKVTVNTQYSGMAFNVPTEMLENNYDTMTVYYKDPVNISTGFGCGLWQDPNNKDTETVAAWGGVFSAADEEGNILQEGEYTAALGEGNTTTWYINKALFFFNDADSLSTNGPAQVTITKVVFSNSKYTGGDKPEPTPGSEVTASPEPSDVPPAAVKLADDAVITVDGIADEAAYADVAAYDIASRVACDNKKDSDTTATAKLMWKADALYGFVSVKDADIAKFGNNNYQWDGVELFLDEDNSRDTDWANNTDAFQYRYTGYTKTEEGVANDAAAALFAGGSDAAKAQYAGIETKYVFTEDGYDVEFKIPFKDAKEIDSVVGFDIIVQDCDSEGRNAEIYMFPTDKTKSYWNLADVFGELTLKDVAPVGPEVDELITNGDFNDGTTGWSSNYSDDAISVETIDGDNVLKMTGRWNQFSGAKRLMQGDFKKGDKLTVKLDAFTEDTLGTSCTVIFCYNGGEKTAINKEIKVAEWNRALEYEYVLEEDTTELDMQIRIQNFENMWNGDAKQDFCIDNVSVVRTPVAE